MIGQKCCSNTHVFPIWYNGWVQTKVSQSEGRYEKLYNLLHNILNDAHIYYQSDV